MFRYAARSLVDAGIHGCVNPIGLRYTANVARMACCARKVFLLLAATLITGCETVPSGNGGAPSNSTDPTNGGARYVGAEACASCHSAIADDHDLHGHAHALSSITGRPPMFPSQANRAGVPDPPVGFAWTDIAWVIGGYSHGARFVDLEGNLLTTGANGVDALWLLESPANGVAAGFAAYLPDQASVESLSFDRFNSLTTGAVAFDADDPRRQQNRPGVGGTWALDGVQCEACHGPGSNHFTISDGAEVIDESSVMIDRSAIYVDTAGDNTCNACHSATAQSAVDSIIAADGFIAGQQQYSELSASGGHSSFACRVCHEPHRSVLYDRANAIRNDCTDCHDDANMALHDGAIFVRGDYTETVTCESCHMPFATRTASRSSQDVVAAPGRMGDTRTHIFRVSTGEGDVNSFLSADGMSVALDDEGMAAVTLDYVCLRCHNDSTEGLFSLTIERASEISANLHMFGDQNQ